MSEQTVEDFNAREKLRASIVARLLGYTLMANTDTVESLKAEYLEVTGEPYRSQEEEQAANVRDAKERRQQRIETQLDSDRQIIAEAKANGFQDCLAIRDGLGWDKPAPNGSYYNAMQTAYRWIEDAGEEVVYLIPDGITDVTKSERTGCWPGVFYRVQAYKNAVFAKRTHDEWTANMDSAIVAREQEGAQTKNMDWDAYIEGLGPEPPAPDQAVLALADDRAAARKATLQAMRTATASRAAANEESYLQAMREYTGPLNKRGYPKGPFMGLRGKAKRALWDRRNG